MFNGRHTVSLYDVVRDANGVPRKVTPEVKNTYFFSELTLQAQETLNNWIRKRHVAVIQESVSSLPEELQREAILDSVKEAATLSWQSDYGQKLLQCVDGITLIALVCIAQNHEDVTYEELREKIALKENFEEVVRVVKLSSETKAFYLARELENRKAQTLRAQKKEQRQNKKKGRSLKKRAKS